MKKELKNYLHFYLGCEAAIDYDPSGNAGMQIHKIVGVYTVGVTTSNGYMEDFKKVKPLLRKISSMTEHEKDELYHIDDHALFELGGDGAIGYALPSVFLWLLSKHFDLFSLIEDGLAIDKTTLTH